MSKAQADQIQSVRQIPRKGGSLTGEVNVARFNQGIPYESGLERDFVILTAINMSVQRIVSQPCHVDFLDPEGTSRRYTPDYLVTFSGNKAAPRLVEIKYSEELQKKSQELEPKFNAARAYADDRGWEFSVSTENEIRIPKLDNARTLLPLQGRKPNPGLCARVLSQIPPREKISVSELLDKSDLAGHERARGRNAVFSLIATGVLITDLEKTISESSLVRRFVEGVSHGTI
jgi:hypothetical protein